MISLTSNALKVRLVLEAMDMRKSFNGLSGVIRSIHEGEPNPTYVYVFGNKRRNRIKILYYDRSGVQQKEKPHQDAASSVTSGERKRAKKSASGGIGAHSRARIRLPSEQTTTKGKPRAQSKRV